MTYEERKNKMDEIRKGLDELENDMCKTKIRSEYFADLSDGDIMLIIKKDGCIKGFIV